MKIKHLVPILFLAGFCTVSAQTNNFSTRAIISDRQTPHRSGIVRYPDGEPAIGVHITFYPGSYYSDDDYNYHEAVTDKNGHYEIIPPTKDPRFSEGPINLTNCIMARDFEKNLAAIQAFYFMTTNVDLILQPAITLSGSVKNIEGAPISGAEISLGFEFARSGIEMRPPFKANEQGQFSIPALPQGVEYWSLSKAKGYGSFWMQVPAKDTVTNHYSFPPIVLNTANRILAGKVIGPDEKPIPGITVRFGGKGQPRGTNDLVDFPTTKTDTNGNFIFNEVCEGEVQITVFDWADTESGHILMSSVTGAKSMFQAGDTNVVIKVVDQDYANFETTPLHKAARDGNTNLVKVLIANHADINAKERDGRTPLHWAALNGHLDVVNLLLANGAAVDAVENDGKTPLHCAAMNDHLEIIKLLLANGAKIDARERGGVTPLHETAVHGQEEITTLLLASNADVNVKADNGFTPLHWAALHGQMKVAEVLLAHGAEVNPMNNNGETPLHWAVQNRQNNVADLLRRHGGLENGYAAGKPANATTNWNIAAFRGAIQSGDVKEMEKLLKEDPALIDIKDEQDRTPLILAAMSNRGQLVERLLSYKADINARDTFGRTALHWAALVGAQDAAQALADHKADLAAKVEGGATPLHYAARNGFPRVAEVLVAHGAEINAPDSKGNTPLQWVEAELKTGPPADPTTPLAKIYAAKLKGRNDVAEWLRQHGGHE